MKEFLVHYNESKHNTTRFASIETVERSKDFFFIQYVKNNTNSSRKLMKDKDEKYKGSLKVRIWNYKNLDPKSKFIYFSAQSFIKKYKF